MTQPPTQAQAQPATHVPPHIRDIIRRLRRQIRSYIWLEGLAVALTWAGLAFWIGLALDYLPVLAGANEMPRAARWVMLGAFSLVLVLLLYRFVIRRAFVRLTDRSLAIVLERQFPQFNDTLVTAVDTTVDTSESPNADGAALRQAMLQHTVDLAADRSRHIDTTEALRYRPLLGKGLAAGIAVISILLFGWLARDAFATWTGRLFLLSDAPWPRRTHIEVLDFPGGHRKVAEGTDLTLRVRAVADRPTPPPSTCTIDYRFANGDRGRVNMSRDGEPRDGYQFYRYQGPPFQGMLETISFDVVGYDHRVRDLQVNVVARPSIVDVQLDCQLPEYMDRPPRHLTWRPGTRLPVGTQITLTVRVTKPLEQVTVKILETGESADLQLSETAESLTFAYRIPSLTSTASLEFDLLDHDGVTSRQPYRLSINAVEDDTPQIDIQLRGIGTAITPLATLPVVGEIHDDYQVKDTWFQIDHPADSTEHRVTFPTVPSGSVDQHLDLRQQRNDDLLPWPLESGDKLVVSVRASDFFDLNGAANIGQSDLFPLDIVSPQELLALLEARELNLKRRFEQTIDELIDTRDSLLRVQASLTEATGEDDAPKTEGNASPQDDSASRDNSLRRLRVQRARQQGTKSQQEVQGVAASFASIRDELVNNRIDTPERRDRLQDLIIRPLEIVAADDFTRWLDQLTQLEQHIETDASDSLVHTSQVVQQTNELILTLQSVLENMLELETFNELLDLVRSIVSEQDALRKETNAERKRLERALLED